ncbi:hypothetical protein CNECB9_740005 [Cupriavidus necator]|uniref:Uncharacterized protein n=1 Tax=Cupriavidus necator TaxID=106590 RepID=A0A1K0JM24_CUPNE|nr:hypothetical protein CNECB9_740005 [Cupriavidus necator]
MRENRVVGAHCPGAPRLWGAAGAAKISVVRGGPPRTTVESRPRPNLTGATSRYPADSGHAAYVGPAPLMFQRGLCGDNRANEVRFLVG